MLSSDKEKVSRLAEQFRLLEGESPEGGSNKRRGTNTMFRVAYSTHLSLSQMADRKAHLMLGLNTFVLSFVIAKRKMGLFAHSYKLLIPNILLVTLCLTCIVLAILASRPRNPQKPKEGSEVPVNWLFFGSFIHVPLEEFQENIERLLYTPKILRNAMTQDLYYLGVSLERKYYYLQLCYSVFYYGLLVVVSSYVFCSFFS